MLAAHRRAPVVAAFATAARPTVDEAVSFLADVTGQPVAVAAYLLAPGLFHDRLGGSAGTWVSGPIGDHPAVAELVLDRFRDQADTATAARSLLPGRGPPLDGKLDRGYPWRSTKECVRRTSAISAPVGPVSR